MRYINTYHLFEGKKELSLTKKQFEKILKKDCSDFDWSDTPIYRSTYDGFAYGEIDPHAAPRHYKHKGERLRMSQNAPNHYTMLINHLPSWKDFPKRQVICSTYPVNLASTTYRVIPYDGSVWGIVPGDDIHSRQVLQGSNTHPGTHYIYDNYDEAVDICDMCFIFDEEIDHDDTTSLIDFKIAMKKAYNKTGKDIFSWDKMNKIFAPETMGFIALDYMDFINYDFPDASSNYHETDEPSCEVWTDAHCLLIKASIEYEYNPNSLYNSDKYEDEE